MSKFSLPAVAALVALTFATVPVSLLAAEANAGPEVSPAATKAMRAVQQAAEEQQYAEMITRAEKVLQVSGRTPADVFVAYQFLAFAHEKQANKAGVLTAMQGQLDSGYPEAAEQNRIIATMTRIAYEQKNYPQTVEFGNRLVRSGSADAVIYGLIGDSLYQQGNFADTSKLLGDYVADQERQTQVPREQTLNTLFSAQEKHGDKAGVTDTLEKLVVHYPKTEYWNLLLYSLGRDPKLTERQMQQVYRLKLATQTLKRCGEITDMADIGINSGMSGEAQKAIELGLAEKVCTAQADQERLQRMLASTTATVAEDKAELANLEAEAKTSKSGELDVVVGSSLFGYGEYSRAAEALSRGITKGGLKNLPDAQMMLGIAQIRAGAKAEGVSTLRSIQNEDPVNQRIVRLWMVYAR